jgi:anti-sigma regulatory factor (Ser/Thr protein kinase)
LASASTGENEHHLGKLLSVSKGSLSLSASPRSVADARRWVVDACRELDRQELAESAELAVSELVTNALLHAEPPISVRLGGTQEFPRFEVSDGSIKPPSPALQLGDDDVLTTTGRGLSLVAMCSSAWGARIQADGKVVWFVPVAEPRTDASPHSAVIEYDVEPQRRVEPIIDPVHVALLGVPRRLYLDFRHRYREIRRELRLLALASEESYPIARSLSDLFLIFDQHFRLGAGGDQLAEFVVSDHDTADLDFIVDRESIASIAQMIDVLELTETFARSERMLTAPATPEQTAFRRWYLGEFISQGRNKPPAPWADA